MTVKDNVAILEQIESMNGKRIQAGVPASGVLVCFDVAKKREIPKSGGKKGGDENFNTNTNKNQQSWQ